jgi:exo-beta-1,3-glucanase (GH17 family)
MEVLTLIPAGQGLWKADHAGVKSRLPDLYGVSVYAKLPLQEGKKNTKYWYDYAIANVANGKPVMLGEVGWPSAGKPDNRAAVTSVENEKIYTTDIVNAVKDGQLGSTFLFEA